MSLSLQQQELKSIQTKKSIKLRLENTHTHIVMIMWYSAIKVTITSTSVKEKSHQITHSTATIWKLGPFAGIALRLVQYRNHVAIKMHLCREVLFIPLNDCMSGKYERHKGYQLRKEMCPPQWHTPRISASILQSHHIMDLNRTACSHLDFKKSTISQPLQNQVLNTSLNKALAITVMCEQTNLVWQRTDYELSFHFLSSSILVSCKKIRSTHVYCWNDLSRVDEEELGSTGEASSIQCTFKVITYIHMKIKHGKLLFEWITETGRYRMIPYIPDQTL